MKNILWEMFSNGFGTPNCVGRDAKEFADTFDKFCDNVCRTKCRLHGTLDCQTQCEGMNLFTPTGKRKGDMIKPVLQSICNLFNVSYDDAERKYKESRDLDVVYDWASKSSMFTLEKHGSSCWVTNGKTAICISTEGDINDYKERVSKNELLARRILTMLNRGE